MAVQGDVIIVQYGVSFLVLVHSKCEHFQWFNMKSWGRIQHEIMIYGMRRLSCQLCRGTVTGRQAGSILNMCKSILLLE